MFGIVKYSLTLDPCGNAHLQTWYHLNCVIGYWDALNIDNFFMVTVV